MKELRISVVLCFRNDAVEVSKTIDSICKQLLQPDEIIIVDDGSDSHNQRLVANIASLNHKIKLLRSSSHIGLTRSLIWGCNIATGDIIARIDAGDVAHPHRLFYQASVLSKNPFIVAVGSWVNVNNSTVRYPRMVQKITLAWGGTTIAHPAATFRADSYRIVGGYSNFLTYAQDMDLWKRLMPIGAIVNIPIPLTTRLLSPLSISVTKRLNQLDCVILSSRRLYKHGKMSAFHHCLCLFSCAIRSLARIILNRVQQ